MKLHVNPSRLAGRVEIPGSKSHTIRALLIAALAEGVCEIRKPLDSADTRAALATCRALGAYIETTGDLWRVEGTGGAVGVPDNVIDVGNSGTTLYVALGSAALADGFTVFTGDAQIRRRPVEALLGALRDLGAEAFSTRGNGCAPVIIRGPLTGGAATIACPTSQYLTSLLINAPLARGDVEITVTELNERPYVQMTMDWLDSQGIVYRAEGMENWHIPGGQAYRAFSRDIPADFSTATFFLCAAALSEKPLTLVGLDMDDSQGDKAVVDYLAAMGAQVSRSGRELTVHGGALTGTELDLNATPDALPMLAVTGCYAAGETRLVNVPQARLKETDRIAVMASELRHLGGDVDERPDGLVIRHSPLRGGTADGHGDHRVVMALAVSGLFAAGATHITTAEAVAVTFPEFAQLMRTLGADMEVASE